jgi:FkbM family methyltransferase|tara:strand:- start:11455 stop:12108 length:654 start_codon:yes stop_codon:yes gene_type:complete
MKKIKNTNFYIPTGDTYLTTKPTYKLEEFEMAKPHFKNNSVAIDVGAHVGFWTSRLAVEFDRVVAIEPCEDYIKCLNVNCLENEPKIEVHGLGLGDEHNVVLELDRVISNSTLTSTADWICDEQTTQYTLDAMFEDELFDVAIEDPLSLDFIKISVEGHELAVLEGAVETIKKWKPTIFIEVKQMEDEDVAEFMTELGYEIAEDDLTSYVWVHSDSE